MFDDYLEEPAEKKWPLWARTWLIIGCCVVPWAAIWWALKG